MRLAIISDTHLPRGSRALPGRCVALCAEADVILHAGDLVTMDVLDELRALGPPVVAVHGNVDRADVRAALPESVVEELGGVRVGMVHDGGPSSGRVQRLRRRFPDADAVVFGHSHIPLHEAVGGFQIFNPGSPTDRRRQPRHTMGVATAGGGRIAFEHVVLD